MSKVTCHTYKNLVDDLAHYESPIAQWLERLSGIWKVMGSTPVGGSENRPFPSSLVPLFQNESKCKTILMKMTLIRMKMKLHAKLIFI